MNPAIGAYLRQLKAQLTPPPPGPAEIARRERAIAEIIEAVDNAHGLKQLETMLAEIEAAKGSRR
jgi:hypothetical protein